MNVTGDRPMGTKIQTKHASVGARARKGGGVSLWGVSQGPVLKRECHLGLGVLEGHLTISEISLVLLPSRLWKSNMDLYLCSETEEMTLSATCTPANGSRCP